MHFWETHKRYCLLIISLLILYALVSRLFLWPMARQIQRDRQAGQTLAEDLERLAQAPSPPDSERLAVLVEANHRWRQTIERLEKQILYPQDPVFIFNPNVDAFWALHAQQVAELSKLAAPLSIRFDKSLGFKPPLTTILPAHYRSLEVAFSVVHLLLKVAGQGKKLGEILSIAHPLLAVGSQLPRSDSPVIPSAVVSFSLQADLEVALQIIHLLSRPESFLSLQKAQLRQVSGDKPGLIKLDFEIVALDKNNAQEKTTTDKPGELPPTRPVWENW